ncbi:MULTISPECIES: hypothetical protein [unclassified Streptomyces]|uniref:hypothetical protein n=1 Tax=unclassified Streptomyces TaxID=2593676 RepID=UPI002E2ACD93|nr:hypothetical protein [Streptomyces sp. NBC_00285]
MTHLIVLALATFFAWECVLLPLVRPLCDLLRLPDVAAGYLKSLTALGAALALDHWVDRDFLLPIAAASLAGMLTMLRRSSETQNISAIVRGRARRGMPMPGP